ncbi:hypothetical protein HaLaN_01022 [Haematococcus lacustris]|uniref:Uncharacterized protein n=1 Tax=Haematococcus lacustris TaxID=44745 RepID=A0A699YEZ3_HAELA|nr:hypothetical protein HaLaN_01022 [Haematococcus lacustris]
MGWVALGTLLAQKLDFHSVFQCIFSSENLNVFSAHLKVPGAAPGQIADRRATATAEEAQARKRRRWRIHEQHGRLASFKMACMSDLWQTKYFCISNSAGLQTSRVLKG